MCHRVRRIKCDETKPVCVKCTSTGRSCDGYALDKRFRNYTPKQSSEPAATTQAVTNERAKRTETMTGERARSDCSGPVISPHNPLLDFPGTPREQRSLNFFMFQLAPVLGGFFDSNFWSFLLPRVAASEISVYHALIAIATLHEGQIAGSQDSTDHRAISLSHYNKAINALKHRLSSETLSTHVVLLTCLLFICLEFMRGLPERALNHLESGLNILVSNGSGSRCVVDFWGLTNG